ncbi:MAG TPA: enolase C-terminal domain-like protein [Thermoanaerobaculia bacterium]|nr:enolase C-terminal domain-like protein [Thermoanaerobaculia bacterium]
MKAWISRYELVPRRDLSARASSAPRRGALLRFRDGYADLHPWRELGDDPLEEHLDSIVAETPTSLARRSLDCALIDGEARTAGYSLFEGHTVPPSHYPLGALEKDLDFELLRAAGFDRAKLKAGRQPVVESSRLAAATPSIVASGIRIRIDFNSALGVADLDAFLESLPPRLIDHLDFLEDPVPADPNAWKEIRSRWGVRIAADREKPATDSWDVAVIKPAYEGDRTIALCIDAGKPLVFTSALDHPLGQLWAAWNAAVALRDHPGRVLACGLLTHDAYERNAFSDLLSSIGPVLIPPRGAGLGFGDLLEALPWKRLS